MRAFAQLDLRLAAIGQALPAQFWGLLDVHWQNRVRQLLADACHIYQVPGGEAGFSRRWGWISPPAEIGFLLGSSNYTLHHRHPWLGEFLPIPNRVLFIRNPAAIYQYDLVAVRYAQRCDQVYTRSVIP